MKDLLERIAVEGTENRRYEILEILDEYDIPYELQEIKREFPDFSSSYYHKSLNAGMMALAAYQSTLACVPDLGDDDLNDFIKEDIYSNLPEDEASIDELIDEDFDNIYASVYDFESDNTSYTRKYNTEYLYNIIIKPSKAYKESKNKILFSAHYDVVYKSTGANDNGSSLAILLRLAIMLKESNLNLPIGIVFFDGEERGGIGSKAYIDKYVYTKELKDELTLVNLDVCGCGEHIVIVDNIKNRQNDAMLLLDEKVRRSYSIVEAPSFPFSDASIFKSNDIGTLSISVFPDADVKLLNAKDTNDILFGRKHFGSYIFDYMHNGPYDNIAYINYDIMEKTLSYIINCLKID